MPRVRPGSIIACGLQVLRHPHRLALVLALIAVTCAWPTLACADPPTRPGSEVVDPWAPGAMAHAHTAWTGPEGNEVIDPWRGAQNSMRSPADTLVVDPWQGQSTTLPTASFPPREVIDPWAR